MAEHKVPQDIEAEDKILGPFSFRQFVYLIIAAAAGAVAFALGRLLLPLAIIPVPIVLLFLVLALPLRKDQPMETYLAAMIRFMFTSRVRLWDPDGTETMVEITNPRIDDDPINNKVQGQDAINRLSFLSEIEDTQGWATRGVINNTALNDDLAAAASQTADAMDDSTVATQFNRLLARSDKSLRSTAIATMNQARVGSPTVAPAQIATPTVAAPAISPADEAATEALLAQRKPTEYSVTNNIREKIIQPLSVKPVQSQLAQTAPTLAAPAKIAKPTPPTPISPTPEQKPIPIAPSQLPAKPAIMSDENTNAKTPPPEIIDKDDEFEVDLH